jgi:peptidoglycan-N-acetylglucosamine deacetylase
MLLPTRNRPARRPSQMAYLRRRTVAAAAAAGVVVSLVSAIRGDGRLGAISDAIRLSRAAQAQLPWRVVVTDGSAGLLDARGLPGPAAQQAALERYRAIGVPIYCAGGRGRYAALTFDDGPSQFSDRVLRMLAGAGAQGTFFLIGRLVEGSGDIPRRQLAQGAVGDHTWTHPTLTRLSTSDVNFELGQTKRVLERALGQPIVLFRSPYEAHDPAVDARVRAMGLLQVLWNVDTRDSAGASTDAIAQNARDGLRPGSIILMHETYDRSVAALPSILAEAKRRGLRLVSVPQLLALDPPTDDQVRAGFQGCEDSARYQREREASAMRLSARG